MQLDQMDNYDFQRHLQGLAQQQANVTMARYLEDAMRQQQQQQPWQKREAERKTIEEVQRKAEAAMNPRKRAKLLAFDLMGAVEYLMNDFEDYLKVHKLPTIKHNFAHRQMRKRMQDMMAFWMDQA
jgi:hypothetical protein